MIIQLKSDAGTCNAIKRGEGPVVFCLHGFPNNNSSYDYQIEALVEQGFTCIVPTMRGYEPSSIAKSGDYSLIALAEDVESWRAQLNLDRFHLIGHDWGALTAYIYAAQYGERLLSLTTLAIPPLNELKKAILLTPKQYIYSSYIAFFQLRGIAERVYAQNDFAFMQRLWEKWSPDVDWSEKSLEGVKQSFRQPGVVGAALAYYRCLLRDIVSGRANAILAKPIIAPTLVLAGENDGCISITLFDKAIKDKYFTEGIEFKSFANAGHFLHQEIPEIINPILVDWLKSHSPSRVV